MQPGVCRCEFRNVRVRPQRKLPSRLTNTEIKNNGTPVLKDFCLKKREGIKLFLFDSKVTLCTSDCCTAMSSLHSFFFLQKHKGSLTLFILVANKYIYVYIVCLCLSYDSYENSNNSPMSAFIDYSLYIRNTKFLMRVEMNITILNKSVSRSSTTIYIGIKITHET